MAVTGKHGIGIPTVLLFEAEGFTISVETVQGYVYRGFLEETDDFMNLFMRNVSRMREGSDEETKQMDQVYLRGSKIKFIVFPEVMSNSPMFKRVVKFKESKRRFVPVGAGADKASAAAPKPAVVPPPSFPAMPMMPGMPPLAQDQRGRGGR